MLTILHGLLGTAWVLLVSFRRVVVGRPSPGPLRLPPRFIGLLDKLQVSTWVQDFGTGSPKRIHSDVGKQRLVGWAACWNHLRGVQPTGMLAFGILNYGAQGKGTKDVNRPIQPAQPLCNRHKHPKPARPQPLPEERQQRPLRPKPTDRRQRDGAKRPRSPCLQ